MYLIPIAWLYVVILVAAAEDTIVAAVLTFVFWGLAPPGLVPVAVRHPGPPTSSPGAGA